MALFHSINFYLLVFWAFVFTLKTIESSDSSKLTNKKSSSKISDKDKFFRKEIEKAGCEYQYNDQLLQAHVCMEPGYDLTVAPENADWITNVDVQFEKFQVAHVYDRDNRIQLVLYQYMEWEDQAINFYHYSEKLSPATVNKIWHPELDIFTLDLGEWKSLNAPNIYKSVGIIREAYLRNRSSEKNTSIIWAYKHWKADISCEFNLRSYPMDTQNCRFEQTTFWSTLLLHQGDNMGIWKYNRNGFYITISYTGALVQFDEPFQDITNNTFGFDITLERMVQPFLYQYYLPCMAIVLVSQISFIIPLTSIPGRVALVVTQFLTLTNIFIHQTVSNRNNGENKKPNINLTFLFNHENFKVFYFLV